MTLASQIQSKIKKLPEGKSFGYADLGIAKEDFLTAAKALERLQAKGIIKNYRKVFSTNPNKPFLANYSQIIASNFAPIYLKTESALPTKQVIRYTIEWV